MRQHNIPCLAWFEDALGYYGVPTVVFDLFLLVPDIDEAALLLEENGWALPPERRQDPYHFLNAPPHPVCRRLAPPGNVNDAPCRVVSPPPLPSPLPPGPTVTVLLPAADWSFTTEQLVQFSRDGFMPPLVELTDSLIHALLESPDETRYQMHLVIQVCYLYEHVAELKEKSFADRLRFEHRQFHLDGVAGMAMGTRPFIQHERKIWESIKRGEYKLQDCSAAYSDSNRVLFEGILAHLKTE